MCKNCYYFYVTNNYCSHCNNGEKFNRLTKEQLKNIGFGFNEEVRICINIMQKNVLMKA